uniref:Putative actin-like protein 13e n=1 Tax=Ornithodoros turicata TaxID=34597 RepID=A0A2R5LFN8_9ACAR
MDFLSLPTEIIHYILKQCTVADLFAVSQTCRALRDIIQDEFLWLSKWHELCSTFGLTLPAPQLPQESTARCCRRLWACYIRGGSPPPTCPRCHQRTCPLDCLETFERRVTLDIGSKTSWLINTTFALERHPSVVVTPGVVSSRKVLPCLLCRHRRQLLGYQTASHVDPKDYLFVQRSVHSGNWCYNSSQQHILGDCSVVSIDSGVESKEFPLWSEVYGVLRSIEPGCRILSPLECFRGGEREAQDLGGFVGHLLEQHRMLEEVKKPGVSLVLCEPFGTSPKARQALVRILFEEHQVSRLCLVNKAYATALLIGLDTCLVVDSGLSNTVVTLVVNGAAGKAQHCPVGGLAVSKHLADSMKINGEHRYVSLSSLDSSSVKASCRLAYNITHEERCKVAAKRDIFVRYKSTKGSPILEKHSLGPELYLAPELMYASLGLPDMIKSLLEGLHPGVVRDLLGHVLLTGANTELNGFASRLVRDLQAILPEYKYSVNINTYAGGRSWDVVMGATRVPLPCTQSPLMFSRGVSHLPGSFIWLSRDDYILQGPALLNSAL